MGFFFFGLKKQDEFNKIRFRFIVFCTSILIYSFIYYFLCSSDDFYSKRNVDNKKTNDYNRLLEILYFSAITQSTVGFGDISPNSQLARFIVVLQILTSFIIISV